MANYHPDRQIGAPKLAFVLCEEITKLLSFHYEVIKTFEKRETTEEPKRGKFYTWISKFFGRWIYNIVLVN